MQIRVEQLASTRFPDASHHNWTAVDVALGLSSAQDFSCGLQVRFGAGP
jgi:hypothetical protein